MLSLIGLIVGFVVVSSPESFTPEEEQSLQVLVRKEDQEFAKEYWYFKLNLSNTTESDLHLENRSLERNHFHQTRAHLIREGIESKPLIFDPGNFDLLAFKKETYNFYSGFRQPD